MKILQLIYESQGSPFGFGGAGVRAYEIYKRLRNRHQVTLICMKYPGVADRLIEDIPHRFVGTESRDLVKSVLAYTIKAAEYVRRRGHQYDIIVENFLPATPFFSKYLTATPVVLQLQGLWGRNHLRKFNPVFGLPLFAVEKFYPLLYDHFVLVTEVNMNRRIRASGKYCVIPNGIDRELLKSREPEGDYILFLSRIDIHQKGLDVLVDAFAQVARRFDCRLLFAGHETNSINHLLLGLPAHLRDRVEFAGFVSGADKVRLLSRAKVFVMPSRYEAHPISVLEALGCGRPVVVSDIPEFEYISRSGVGLTFANGSAADLAAKISRLLADPALRQSFGPKGRHYATGLLWDELANRFEAFLSRVSTDNGRKRQS